MTKPTKLEIAAAAAASLAAGLPYLPFAHASFRTRAFGTTSRRRRARRGERKRRAAARVEARKQRQLLERVFGRPPHGGWNHRRELDAINREIADGWSTCPECGRLDCWEFGGCATSGRAPR